MITLLRFRCPAAFRVFLFLLVLLASSTQAADDPNAPLATNLTGINDFSDEFPFVNLMKSARDWIPGNASGCFDCRTPGGNAACLAPNACPVTFNLDSDGYISSLQPNQIARTVIHAGNAAGRLPAGDYTVRFDGAGTLQFFGASVVSQSAGEIVVNVASSANNNIGFNLTALSNGNPIRNIRILPPGGVCSNDERRVCNSGNPCSAGATCALFTTPGVAEQQVFQPRFLKNVEGFRLLRFMDWMETNSSSIEQFADYPTPTSAFWHSVPPQVLADLANRIAADIWINVPHRANNDFIDQFATRLRDNFRADRRVFIEYSNENWNGIFSQSVEIPQQFCPGFADLAAGCQNDGVPGNGIACERNPVTFSQGAAQGPCFQALVRAWGDRSVEIFQRFDTVFGASAADRLVRVVAAQAANPDLGRQVLTRNATGQSFSVASRSDAYAIAPYFGTEYCTPDSGINPDTHPSVYANLSNFFADLTSRALPTATGFMTNSRSMLTNNFAAEGLRLIAYEGGQHFAGIGGFTFNATCNTTFDAANADPRMGALYTQYLNNWKQSGDEFTHFSNVGRWGPFGRWGALEFQDQDVSTSPKFSAMQSFSSANPCWWPNCAQTGTGVVDAMFGNGFEGAQPDSCTPTQLILDGGLELTNPDGSSNPAWTSTSTQFGTVFCRDGICPDDGTLPAARTGSFYAWFGGFAGVETSTLRQSLSIPSGAPRHLNFFLRRGRVTPPLDAKLEIRVDGNLRRSFDEPAVAEPAYLARTVDLSALADGGPHQIEFIYANPTAGGTSNFLVDDISVACSPVGE